MMGVVSNQNRSLERLIIQNINRYMVMGVMLYPEMIIKIQEYIGHIQEEKETRQVFNLTGSPYHDAEGSSQLISYLYDAIGNSFPKIGKRLTKTHCIDSDP